MILEWHKQFESADLLWALIATSAILCCALPGLALIHRASTKNQPLAANASDGFLLVSTLMLAWFLWGYSLAFGPGWGTIPYSDPNVAPMVLSSLEEMLAADELREDLTNVHGRGGFIGGPEYVLFQKLAPEGSAEEMLYPTRRPLHHIPQIVWLLYQLAFFLAFPAPLMICSMKFWRGLPLLVFALLWGTLVYLPLAHMVWGEGWLSDRGVVDLGGGLFHLAIGVSGASFIVLVRRFWRRSDDVSDSSLDTGPVSDESFQPSLLPLGAALFTLGALFAHSSTALHLDGQSATSWFNTLVAACSAMLAAVGTSKLIFKRAHPLSYVAGLIAGVTAIAAGCGTIAAQSALVVGVVAGSLCVLVFELIQSRAQTNVPLGLFAVQAVGGSLGVLLTGLFAVSSLGVQRWDGTPVSGWIENSQLDFGLDQVVAVLVIASLALIGTVLVTLLTVGISHLQNRFAPAEKKEPQPAMEG